LVVITAQTDEESRVPPGASRWRPIRGSQGDTGEECDTRVADVAIVLLEVAAEVGLRAGATGSATAVG
jgi:hypothetical protein